MGESKATKAPPTRAQMKAARALLGLTADDLAGLAGLHVVTVRRFESEASGKGTHAATLAALAGALEEAGVAFIAENGGGAGVRLVKGARRAKR
jgi:transcriptional regulator with XRE-family HTH domain